MKLESADLYGALLQIGAECEGERLPRRDILDQLIELKLVKCGRKPALTQSGWRLYSKMEAGDATPEFSDNPF
jgi:hypothetical protein